MNNRNIQTALAEEITLYIQSRKNAKIDSFYKDKPKKNKQGVIVNGAINIRLSDLLKKVSDKQEDISSIEKSKKDKTQSPLEFQTAKYNKLLSLLPNDVVNQDIVELKNELHSFLVGIEEEYNPINWLAKMTPKAEDISFATHVAKLTHSSSKGSSILDRTTEKNNHYLTTSSLNEVVIDTASSNAASLPIADILKLSVDGVSVLDCLKKGETQIFEGITDNKAHIEIWCDNLKQAYDSTSKQSYFLSKQIYFPTEGNQYHLLLPLTSSSLVHALHLKHKQYWEDEEQVSARKQQAEKKYSPIETRRYPHKAYLHVTGSNHSNASSLNGQRGGRIALLPTMPPSWSSRSISYMNSESIFDKELSFELKNDIEELRKYLLLIKNKKLSISEPKRNAAVINKLNTISDHFFDYIQQVNITENNQGWTLDANLLDEQKMLFEPWRTDDKAMAIKANNEWQKKLSGDYGYWLNNQIEQRKKLTLSTIYQKLWADSFLNSLREFVAIQEVEV